MLKGNILVEVKENNYNITIYNNWTLKQSTLRRRSDIYTGRENDHITL